MTAVFSKDSRKPRANGDRFTAFENIAINLVSELIKEELDKKDPLYFEDIVAMIPPLGVLHFQVNKRLRECHVIWGNNPPEFCRFEAGHQRTVYEPYPKQISVETIRKALIVAGLRTPQSRRPKDLSPNSPPAAAANPV